MEAVLCASVEFCASSVYAVTDFWRRLSLIATLLIWDVTGRNAPRKSTDFQLRRGFLSERELMFLSGTTFQSLKARY